MGYSSKIGGRRKLRRRRNTLRKNKRKSRKQANRGTTGNRRKNLKRRVSRKKYGGTPMTEIPVILEDIPDVKIARVNVKNAQMAVKNADVISTADNHGSGEPFRLATAKEHLDKMEKNLKNTIQTLSVSPSLDEKVQRKINTIEIRQQLKDITPTEARMAINELHRMKKMETPEAKAKAKEKAAEWIKMEADREAAADKEAEWIKMEAADKAKAEAEMRAKLEAKEAAQRASEAAKAEKARRVEEAQDI